MRSGTTGLTGDTITKVYSTNQLWSQNEKYKVAIVGFNDFLCSKRALRAFSSGQYG